MEEEFIKEIKVTNQAQASSYEELMSNLEKTKRNLEADYANLQYIDDQSLVDYYTYKIKSDQAQYDYLIKQAKRVETGTYL